MTGQINPESVKLEYASLAGARNLPGLRLILGARAIPGPWREASKGIFHVKRVPYVPVANRGADGTDRELYSAVTVFAAELQPERPRRGVGLGVGGGAIDDQQPLRPAEAVLAAQLVGVAEHQRPIGDRCRNQRRKRLQPLRQIELLDPGGARPLVVPDRYRSAALRGPLVQLPVRPVRASVGDRKERHPLYMKDTFAGLAPGAGDRPRAEDQPQPRQVPRPGEAGVFQLNAFRIYLPRHDAPSLRPRGIH